MRKRLIYLLLSATVLLAATKPQPVNSARVEWMGGFVKMESADKAAADNAVAALELYREALEIFQEVRRKYPQWNPSLLNYRVNYCQQCIDNGIFCSVLIAFSVSTPSAAYLFFASSYPLLLIL